MRILYVSSQLPYDKVDHAGGQTLNYYIKNLAKQGDMDVTLMSYCNQQMIKKVDCAKYGIRYVPVMKLTGARNIFWNILSINSKINPLHKYGNITTYSAARLMKNKMIRLKNENYNPDIIIMEWTQILLIVNVVKSIFPKAKIISSEHDVTFLGWIRKAESANNFMKKEYERCQAKNMKNRELKAIMSCDMVFTHNLKDLELLKQNGIPEEKCNSLVAFYHRSELPYHRTNNDILFFGAMGRIENHQAAVWFIKNVLPLLDDLPIRFVIIGGNPKNELIHMQSDRVVVTGFVDSVDPYFANAMCFVSPLILGAGIKVKVLEALYSGIPVLTNDIGIEGIPAQDGKDYINCSTKSDYANAIHCIYSCKDNSQLVSGKDVIKNKFSLDDSFKHYYKSIKNLANR